MNERRLSRRGLLVAGLGASAVAVGAGAAWYGGRFSGPATLRWRKPLPVPADDLYLTGDTLLASGPGLTAYAAGDGAVRWKADIGRGDIAPGRSGTAPFSSDRDSFAIRTASSGSAVIRVAGLGDGAERWRRSFEGFLGSALLTWGGTVVASADSASGRGLGAFDATGQRWWHALEEADDGPFDLAAGSDTVVVAGRRFSAHNAADGTRRWSLAAGDGLAFGRPALHGDFAVALGMRYIDADFGYRNLAVHGIDVAKGEVRWSYAAPGGFLLDGVPPKAGSTVLAVHEDGTLTGLDVSSGWERWSGRGDATDLAVLGERLFVARAEGVLEVNPATGDTGEVLPERDAYRLAASGSRLAVAAGDTLALYDVR
ncbi:PQQ-binding-like beta-propeller repeat protein [Dactylosporangium salmoneum]|uniref:Pyrrolo-quinoline quinone repeat domain-containing protein n=1 Tax=Dactylosporangium salmoneum TaxID=53361 RepID=A0ABN3HMW1_9ACTN